jgi:hypothetical protein
MTASSRLVVRMSARIAIKRMDEFTLPVTPVPFSSPIVHLTNAV